MSERVAGDALIEIVESLRNDEPDVQVQQAAETCLSVFATDENFDAIMAVFTRVASDLQKYAETGSGLTPDQVSKLCLYLLKIGPREDVMLSSFISASEPGNAVSWYFAQKGVFHKISTEVGIPVDQAEFLINTYVAPFTKWYDTSLSGLFRAIQLVSEAVEDFSHEPGKAIRLLKLANEKRSAIKKLFYGEME